MGTNFYLHTGKKCHACNQPTETVRQFHIGKSSTGWTFSFRGYKIGSLSPDGKPILSVGDWKNAMEQLTCLIFDEYDRGITKAEFWALVEAKKQPLERSGQLKQPLTHAVEYPGDHDWLDDAGNSFSDVEFS